VAEEYSTARGKSERVRGEGKRVKSGGVKKEVLKREDSERGTCERKSSEGVRQNLESVKGER
jgi:hypothetical protein